MKTLMTSSLLNHIDILESERPRSLTWKPLLEQVLTEMSAVQTPHENSGNPLYQSLAKQNRLLMALVLVAIIAGLSK